MKVTHVTFYQGLGALLLVADLGVVALVLVSHTPVDKFVLGLAALPVVGGLALLRPQLLDRWVRTGMRKVHRDS